MHPCRDRHNRRHFIQTAGAASLAASFAGRLIHPSHAFGEDAASKGADVGIARGSSMEEAVRRAVELSGGMDFIKPEQTVLIKPNVTGAIPSPTTTNPEVLYAVIKLVSERGAKRIIVADRSFSALFSTATPKTIDVMKKVGHVEAVNQAISDVKAPVVACGLEDAAAQFEALG
ncbi:MAG TPA: DUF362 domain-containing protein, partial [Pirellulales bacterium]